MRLFARKLPVRWSALYASKFDSDSTNCTRLLHKQGPRFNDSEVKLQLTCADFFRETQTAACKCALKGRFRDPLNFNPRDTAIAERVQSPRASRCDVHERDDFNMACVSSVRYALSGLSAVL